jgi:predicted ArsR family transcriptional regulator
MQQTTFRIADAKVWHALRKPERMRLFEAVRSSGGCSAQQLAARVGMSSPLTHYHLKLLAAAGLLQNAKGKRYRGKGGMFTAATQTIHITVDPNDAAQARRARMLMQAWFELSQEATQVANGTHDWQRWEKLTAAETKNAENVARLAALDQMMAASRAALREAPQDPVLNHYYLSAYSAREATLQALSGALPVDKVIERY